MEDLSRELEDEIEAALRSHKRPPRQRKKKTTRLLLVDDFGTVKSVDGIRTLLYAAIAVAVVSGSMAGFLLSRHVESKKEVADLVSRLSVVEKRLAQTRQDKEFLMAKLVMNGNLPEEFIVQETEKVPEDPSGKPETLTVKEEKTPSDTPEVRAMSSEESDPIQESATGAGENSPEESGMKDDGSGVEPGDEIRPDTVVTIDESIKIEDFKLVKRQNSNAFEARFDIRKMSGKSVAGYAFVVLKHDTANEAEWISVPGVLMKNGRPADPGKGQYFSITNFKPMRFKFNSEAETGYFKTATVIIFDATELHVIFENSIPLEGGRS